MNETFYTLGAVLALIAGAAAALSQLRKAKPESDQIEASRDQILVSAAKDVVLIQRGVVDDLRDQMADLGARLNSQLQVALDAQRVAETALAACLSERREGAALYDAERERNRRAEQEMRDRIDTLEDEVAKLQARARASQAADDENLP